MTDSREQERLAQEANRLLNEPLLVRAFDEVRVDAMIGLTEVDPDNKTEIMRLQAIAKCLEDVRDALSAKILASSENEGGITLEKKRPE